MIQKTKNTGTIQFLNNNSQELYNEFDKNKKSAEKRTKINLEVTREEQKCKKLDNYDNGLKNSNSIFSARTGKITEIGGPSKFIKSDISNSIFNSNRLEEIKNNIDNKTATKIEKQQILDNKRIKEQERMNELVDNLKDTIQSKSSSVFSTGNFSGSKYNSPSQGIGIFGNDNFEKIPEKTAGEQLSENAKNRRSQKDESWRSDGKSISSKEIFNNFMNNLENK